MLLGTAIAGFLQHLRVVRRLSGHTVAGYGRDLRALERALPGATVEGVGGRMVRRAIAVDGGLGAASIARRLSAWRSFFDYWAGREVVRVNPVMGVRGPRRAVRLPRALTPEEMGAVLGTTRGEGWLACRDRAVMELLYSSGVRLGELVRLDVTDVDLRAGVAVVREGKGGHGRVAPVGREARRALEVWLAVRRGVVGMRPLAALFVSRRLTRLAARSVQQLLGRRQRGLPMRLSAHGFRHSCASHFLQSSGGPAGDAGIVGAPEYRFYADLYAAGLSAFGRGL